ncbi:class IV adenylate cyclase [Vibrio diazotrophicus]|uniref:Class IV adenylate cyclase n=1 Tax=Vibrio diazotrophicus TaxID=685 RepID=A0A2J8I7R6_VIBDI|nr:MULTISPECIES: class IV adenylate cyclase [Vibrio]MCF7362302.1 class IV adenylate cyclase [Vibrio sp. A1-b2]PNI06576.1 class IV adenylate cyclase [Vibrio diazotrophicus]
MSSEHFKGKYEVELKFRISSKALFLEVLKGLPHETMLEDNAERDWYFDTPDNALQAQNKSLCIRTMEPSGIKLWIVKGPEADRCEATNITDADNAKSMLQNLGYRVSLQAMKTRSIYFVGNFHITVDSLDGIGDFVEFAIMTDDESKLETYRVELLNLASQFGLTESDLEFKSYKQMFVAKSANPST